jgi:hypothetical protein
MKRCFMIYVTLSILEKITTMTLYKDILFIFIYNFLFSVLICNFIALKVFVFVQFSQEVTDRPRPLISDQL